MKPFSIDTDGGVGIDIDDGVGIDIDGGVGIDIDGGVGIDIDDGVGIDIDGLETTPLHTSFKFFTIPDGLSSGYARFNKSFNMLRTFVHILVFAYRLSLPLVLRTFDGCRWRSGLLKNLSLMKICAEHEKIELAYVSKG